jgi:uncharacterized protein with HEPN domain
MASKSALLRLYDIRDAIAAVEDDTADVTFSEYASRRALRWSVERGIEIISEASRHIPDELKDQFPGIPWRRVAGIGNVLRHEYMDIAADIIWAVVQDELPKLKQVVENMILVAERGDS